MIYVIFRCNGLNSKGMINISIPVELTDRRTSQDHVNICFVLLSGFPENSFGSVVVLYSDNSEGNC